jgi:ribA/ribD-fused uncharacterized protein
MTNAPAQSRQYPIEIGAITRFEDEHWFLSNFAPVPDGVRWNGLVGPTVEHVFQAAKALDPIDQASILRAPGPGVAKRYGRAARMRPDWNEVRVDVMRQCLLSKFSSEDLSSRLLLTGDRQLVEGNHWGDRF